MPDPVPVILLVQLAVDEHYRARRLGSDILVDAAGRCLAAAGLVGARAVFVQAIDERAVVFYAKSGFRPSLAASRSCRSCGSPSSRGCERVRAAGTQAGRRTPGGGALSSGPLLLRGRPAVLGPGRLAPAVPGAEGSDR